MVPKTIKLYLDFTDTAGANRRDPCVNYVSGGVTYPAPFGNISAVCTAGVLANDTGASTQDRGAGTNVPCTASNGDQAPFDGQTGVSGSVYSDLANSQVCNESTGTVTVAGAPATNVGLAQKVSPGIIGAANSNREIFAEAFAWYTYTQAANAPLAYNAPYQRAADGLFANGYFTCAVAFAKSQLTGTFSPPTGHCGH